MVSPRSSIAKTTLRHSNPPALIDHGYRGEFSVAGDNLSDKDYKITAGDRLIQAVSFTGSPIAVQIVDKLDAADRGDGAFGSTKPPRVMVGLPRTHITNWV